MPPASALPLAAGALANLRLIGRFDPPEPVGASSLRFAWSGSTVEVRFSATSLAMRLRVPARDPHVETVDGKPVPFDEKTLPYAVRVDDRPPVVVEVGSDHDRYELASGLDPGKPHVVRITRESEAFAGVHELLGVELAAGGVFLPPRERARRIEIVGDSITCGYGVLGKEQTCPFTFATERATAAYGALLGRMLDADVTTVCWSGKGVRRNFDGGEIATMPELFETTLPEAPQVRWAFGKRPAPDAVVLALGTNDFFGAQGRPLDLPSFSESYVKLARRVREVYPAAWIFVTTSPMLGDSPSSSGPGSQKEVSRTVLDAIVRRRTGEGDKRIELVTMPTEAPHWGCNWHPDAAMSSAMAERLGPVVAGRLGVSVVR